MSDSLAAGERQPAAGATRAQPSSDALVAVARSGEFGRLRSSFRRFAFPMTIFFIVWYAVYVLLSCYATGFMSQRIGGSAITWGLLLGIGQFVTTFVITGLYVRHANRTLDPMAARLKDQLDECVLCTCCTAHQYSSTDVEPQVPACGRQATEDGERHGEVQEEAARGGRHAAASQGKTLSHRILLTLYPFLRTESRETKCGPCGQERCAGRGIPQSCCIA